VAGFRSLRFTGAVGDKHPVATEAPIPVVKLADGIHYCGQEHDGMPILGPDGVTVQPLGMNVQRSPKYCAGWRSRRLRLGLPNSVGREGNLPALAGQPSACLSCSGQTLRSEESRWVEQGLTLHVYTSRTTGAWGEWTGDDRKAALRGLLAAGFAGIQLPKVPCTMNSSGARRSGSRSSDLLRPRSESGASVMRSCRWSRRSSQPEPCCSSREGLNRNRPPRPETLR